MKNLNSILVLLLIGIFLSGCSKYKVRNESVLDKARQKLMKAIPQQSHKSAYRYTAVMEEKVLISASLVDKSIGSYVELKPNHNNLILGYYLDKSERTDSLVVYESRLVSEDSNIYAEIKNLNTKLAQRVSSAADIDAFHPNRPVGDLNDCSKEFFASSEYSELQELANSNCKTYFYGIICDLYGGKRVSIHFVIEPKSFLCTLQSNRPELPNVYKQVKG